LCVHDLNPATKAGQKQPPSNRTLGHGESRLFKTPASVQSLAKPRKQFALGPGEIPGGTG
jgi:hypothetical protein